MYLNNIWSTDTMKTEKLKLTPPRVGDELSVYNYHTSENTNVEVVAVFRICTVVCKVIFRGRTSTNDCFLGDGLWEHKHIDDGIREYMTEYEYFSIIRDFSINRFEQ